MYKRQVSLLDEMLLELSARAQERGFDAALAAVKARGQRFDRFAVEIAVSYTHLDVYKRQAFVPCAAGNVRKLTCLILPGVGEGAESG